MAAATSSEGAGVGLADKLTTKELTVLATGPSILLCGSVELAEDFMVNPPTPTATVTLSTPLPDSYLNYAVIVSGLNTGPIYISAISNTGLGDFLSFSVIGQNEGTCMYFITRIGTKPNIVF